jgi:DNA primase
MLKDALTKPSTAHVLPSQGQRKELESIQSIKSRYNLVSYIGQSVKLRKSGNRFTGLCPFHSEKKQGSFTVYPDDHFHCFGCGVTGDIINFVSLYEKITIKDAIIKLADAR